MVFLTFELINTLYFKYRPKKKCCTAFLIVTVLNYVALVNAYQYLVSVYQTGVVFSYLHNHLTTEGEVGGDRT